MCVRLEFAKKRTKFRRRGRRPNPVSVAIFGVFFPSVCHRCGGALEPQEIHLANVHVGKKKEWKTHRSNPSHFPRLNCNQVEKAGNVGCLTKGAFEGAPQCRQSNESGQLEK